MLKRIISLLLLSFVLVGFGSFSYSTSPVLAGPTADAVQKNLIDSGVTRGGYDGAKKIEGILGELIKTLLSILGIIFIIMIIYAGFKWIQAEGDEGKIGDARKMIIHSVIGLIVVLSAYSITLFVLNRLQDATGAGKT